MKEIENKTPIYLIGANNADGGFNDVIAVYEQKYNAVIIVLNTPKSLQDGCLVVNAYQLVQMQPASVYHAVIPPNTRQYKRMKAREAEKERKKQQGHASKN